MMLRHGVRACARRSGIGIRHIYGVPPRKAEVRAPKPVATAATSANGTRSNGRLAANGAGSPASASRNFPSKPRLVNSRPIPSTAAKKPLNGTQTSAPSPSTPPQPAASETTTAPPTPPPPAAAAADASIEQQLRQHSNYDFPQFPAASNGTREYLDNNGYMGIGSQPFPPQVAEVLSAQLAPEEIEIKPDGLLYLPEIRYRRILNRAFGPGGWGLFPKDDPTVEGKTVSREYALFAHGRLVSIARGEQEFFNESGVTTALEGCKSNALMRCCKDLLIASELWDPDFIRDFKERYCESKFHAPKKRFVWKLKRRPWEYPYNQ